MGTMGSSTSDVPGIGLKGCLGSSPRPCRESWLFPFVADHQELELDVFDPPSDDLAFTLEPNSRIVRQQTGRHEHMRPMPPVLLR